MMMERGLAVIEVESENGCMSESYVQGINEKAPQFLEDIEWYSIEHWQGSIMKQLLVTILNLAMVEGVNDEKEKECLPRKHSVSLCAWSAFTPISLNLVHYHTHFPHFMLTVPSLPTYHTSMHTTTSSIPITHCLYPSCANFRLLFHHLLTMLSNTLILSSMLLMISTPKPLWMVPDLLVHVHGIMQSLATNPIPIFPHTYPLPTGHYTTIFLPFHL